MSAIVTLVNKMIKMRPPSENLEYDLNEPKFLSQEFPLNSQKKSEVVNISHK